MKKSNKTLLNVTINGEEIQHIKVADTYFESFKYLFQKNLINESICTKLPSIAKKSKNEFSPIASATSFQVSDSIWVSSHSSTNVKKKNLLKTFETFNINGEINTIEPNKINLSDVNYWVFQGNPKYYDISKSIQDGNLKTWSVKAHKDKIKKGDKFILWTTGNKSGCYALGEVTSDVFEGVNDNIELQYYLTESDNTPNNRVQITITHDFTNEPISKSEIAGNIIFNNFKGGNQGTNFFASREQFDYFDNSLGVKESRFHSLLERCSEDEKKDFFSLLNYIIDQLKIEKGDTRITYSVPQDRIALTIGQRYAISLQPNTKRGSLGIISVALINDSSEMYDGTPPQPYYTYFNKFDFTQEQTQDITQACQNELNKTTKSGYLKSSNQDFEEYTFNNNYPRALQENINTYKSIMTNVGFEFIKKQQSNRQNRGNELVFSHPKLIKKLRAEGNKVLGEKFYIKHLNDMPNSQIGLVNGKSTTLNQAFSIEANGQDTFDNAPAWFNKNLNQLLKQIKKITSPSMKHAVNTILYGPPGTGKTYNTAKYCAEILTGQDFTDRDEDARKLFNSNLGNQIEFITFHQNYSYEDFIQGLRPDIKSDNLSFDREDGIFKIISDRATRNLIESRDSSQVKIEFDLVFENFISPMTNEETDEIEVAMKKSSYFINEVTEKTIFFRKTTGESKHSLSINSLKKMYEKGINDVIKGGLQPYYDPLLNTLLKLGKTNKSSVSRQNYIIVIDEINRANISRVFGELITLIEDDKRSEGDTPLKCKLPSGDDFQIPSNLYILGTMNTADKSIALLDIALRRRFEFVPLYPNPDLAKTEEKKSVLEKLNKRIFIDKGPDFQIGHSYFMKDDSLIDCMNKKVVPLLTEYYMNSTDEVIGFLREAGFDTTDKNTYPIQVTTYNG